MRAIGIAPTLGKQPLQNTYLDDRLPDPRNTVKATAAVLAAESLLGGDFSLEPNVDLSFDVPPLFRLTENTYEFLKRVDIRWSVFEPRKEIEGLAEIATVVEAARDCWEVFQADPDVSRSGFEYRPPFTLAKLPPGFRLRDWNKGGTGGFWPS